MKKSSICLVVYFAVIFISISSCKKNKNANDTNSPKIHALVSEHLPSGGAKLTLWKDGQLTTIIEQDEADLSGLAVADNGDVYICGYQPNISGADIAKYWKNGTPTALSTLSSDANDIKLNGTDIYVAGREGQRAVVWKNGSPAYLTNGIYQATATSVFVSGTDVYTGLNMQNSSLNSVAQIWKNGQLYLTHSNGSKDAYISSIFINGTDIYACGYDYYSGDLKRPVLWKNGIKTYLGQNGGDAHEVFVYNNDVYVAGLESVVSGGSERPRAKYWKNGVPTVLGQGYSSVCFSIKVVGEDVYCAGNERETASSISIAKYWKNGIPVTFKNTANNTYASKIFVK